VELRSILIMEIQRVYESQGIMINDKHFEVIVREMSDKVRIDNSGDTILLPGELVDKARFTEENSRVLAAEENLLLPNSHIGNNQGFIIYGIMVISSIISGNNKYFNRCCDGR